MSDNDEKAHNLLLQHLITVLKSGLLIFQKNIIAKRQLALGFENDPHDETYKFTVNEPGIYNFDLPFKHKSKILDQSYDRKHSRIQITCNKKGENIKININNTPQSKKIISDLSLVLTPRLLDLIKSDKL